MYWIPHSLSVEGGFRIPRAEFRIPKPTTPDSTNKISPDPGLRISLKGRNESSI